MVPANQPPQHLKGWGVQWGRHRRNDELNYNREEQAGWVWQRPACNKPHEPSPLNRRPSAVMSTCLSSGRLFEASMNKGKRREG